MDRELFISNCLAAKDDLRWHGLYGIHHTALLFTEKGITYDRHIMLASLKYLRGKTSTVSCFRSMFEPVVAAKMSLSYDGSSQLQQALSVYGMMRGDGAFPTYYTANTAWEISARSAPNSYRDAVYRAKTLNSLVKNRHMFLSDYLVASYLSMAAATALEPRAGAEFLEKSYIKALRMVRCSPHSALCLGALIMQAGLENGAEAVSEFLAELSRYRIKATSLSIASLGLSALLAGSLYQGAGQIADNISYLRSFSLFRWSSKSYLATIASSLYLYGILDGQHPHQKMVPRAVMELLASQQPTIAAIRSISESEDSSYVT